MLSQIQRIEMAVRDNLFEDITTKEYNIYIRAKEYNDGSSDLIIISSHNSTPFIHTDQRVSAAMRVGCMATLLKRRLRRSMCQI
jgi:hypothetical protein